MKRKLTLILGGILCLAAKAPATPTASVETTTGDFSNPSGWAMVAEARSGSNGNDNSPWLDFDLIDPSWNGDGGYVTWDPDLVDGFHSGLVTVSLLADLSAGTATFSVTDSSNNTFTAYYSGLAGSVQKVMIRAALETVGFSGWHTPVVNFYKNGTCVETWWNATGGPAVDTTSTSYTSAEQTVTVTPSASDDDKVEIVGQFEFDTGDSCPSPDDLFNQIFLFTH